MKLTFWGAAQEVTGSKHLLHVGDKTYLIDCGLYQGGDKEFIQHKNREFLFPVEKIDGMIITHAHIDHIGLLPYFVKNGYNGPIYATPATRDLVAVMLQDSARIQEMDYEYAVAKNLTDETQYCAPLYSLLDVPATMKLFQTVHYGTEFRLGENVRCIFSDAGHVLGSACVEVFVTENGKETKILFSGDLGRKNLPILRDPTLFDKADYVVIESTYGSKLHASTAFMKPDIEKAVNDVVRRGGRIIIPAFSLERTQEMLYMLHELYNEKKIPNIPIFVDSPLSYNVTKVFNDHPESYDKETYGYFVNQKENPFSFGKLKFTQGTEESKALNYLKEPCIILAASGMADAGRVRHHIAHGIGDPKNMILIIGYQAEGTLGRRLVEKEKHIKVLGKWLSVEAEIRVLNSFSAHAGQDELLEWILHMKGVQKLFLVHGERTVMDIFEQHILQNAAIPQIFMPKRGEMFDLLSNDPQAQGFIQNQIPPYTPNYCDI